MKRVETHEEDEMRTFFLAGAAMGPGAALGANLGFVIAGLMSFEGSLILMGLKRAQGVSANVEGLE